MRNELGASGRPLCWPAANACCAKLCELVQAAVHQCAHRFEQKSALESIAQFGLDGQIFVLRDVGADYIARFDQIGDPKEAGLEREVSLPGPIRDCNHFLRVGEPLFEAVRVSQRKPTSPKGDNQGMRIFEPSRHIRRLLAERNGLFAIRPVEFDTQPREHLGEQRTFDIAQYRPGFPKELNEAMIGHSGKADVPAGREYGAGEQFGSVDTARNVGGFETGLASLAEITGLDLRFAEIAEQLRLERIVPGALERERFNRVVQMSRRLLVGELLFRGPRGLPRIFDGGIGIAGRARQ